jgi:hypothetical protein
MMLNVVSGNKDTSFIAKPSGGETNIRETYLPCPPPPLTPPNAEQELRNTWILTRPPYTYPSFRILTVEKLMDFEPPAVPAVAKN